MAYRGLRIFLTGAILLVSACSFNEEALWPSLTGESPVGVPAQWFTWSQNPFLTNITDTNILTRNIWQILLTKVFLTKVFWQNMSTKHFRQKHDEKYSDKNILTKIFLIKKYFSPNLKSNFRLEALGIWKFWHRIRIPCEISLNMVFFRP